MDDGDKMAFESGVMKRENNQQTIVVQSGLVAFVDILGFKQLLSANAAEESLKIINACMLKGLAGTENLFPRQAEIKTFVISDSILIVQPNLTEAGIFVLAMFCKLFFYGLLMDGLPARGAIAAGNFFIQTTENQIVFAGQPIVEAYELANSLEIATCALTPSIETKVSLNLLPFF